MGGEAKRKPGYQENRDKRLRACLRACGLGGGGARSLNRGKHSKPGTMGSAR